MYFYGTFEHSIDDRGRIAVPARYRRALLDGGVVRPARDGCLELYTHEGFEAETQRRLGEEGTRRQGGRRRRRNCLPKAFDVDLDRQGRIVVPQEMRTAAGLDGRVAIVGCGDYVELWDPQRWAAELDAADSEAEEDEA